MAFERYEPISYANYDIGGTTADAEELILRAPESFDVRFQADVWAHHEVTAIHPKTKTVSVKNLTIWKMPISCPETAALLCRISARWKNTLPIIFDGFRNIPVDELDKSRPVYVICQNGLRSDLAACILMGNGFDCYNFVGGFRFYDAVKNDRCLIE